MSEKEAFEYMDKRNVKVVAEIDALIAANIMTRPTLDIGVLSKVLTDALAKTLASHAITTQQSLDVVLEQYTEALYAMAAQAHTSMKGQVLI